HPFVRGIGDGSLEPARFRRYVRQDYLFLIDYGRLLALACARAPRLELAERFAELARATLLDELALHRSYAAEREIAADELEAAAGEVGSAGRERMRRAFVESSRHELAFWQACWEDSGAEPG